MDSVFQEQLEEDGGVSHRAELSLWPLLHQEHQDLSK